MLRGVDGIATTHFTSADVVRHPLVARIVEAYDAAGAGRRQALSRRRRRRRRADARLSLQFADATPPRRCCRGTASPAGCARRWRRPPS